MKTEHTERTGASSGRTAGVLAGALGALMALLSVAGTVSANGSGMNNQALTADLSGVVLTAASMLPLQLGDAAWTFVENVLNGLLPLLVPVGVLLGVVGAALAMGGLGTDKAVTGYFLICAGVGLLGVVYLADPLVSFLRGLIDGASTEISADTGGGGADSGTLLLLAAGTGRLGFRRAVESVRERVGSGLSTIEVARRGER